LDKINQKSDRFPFLLTCPNQPGYNPPVKNDCRWTTICKPTDPRRKKINQLRNRIFSSELAALPGDPAGKEQAAGSSLRQRVTETVRMLRRVTDFFLEDFYPVEGTLEQKARSIRIDLDTEVTEEEINGQVAAFLDYSRALKQKILFDFSSVNAGFQDFLTQVSQLELIISTEFDAEDKENRFQSFENSIGREMGAISVVEAMAMASPGEFGASLLDRADQAMYRDKNRPVGENGASSF
jgi:hypothetical protein